MKTIAVWHTSVSAMTAFANRHAPGCLVTAIEDSEMRHKWWGLYNLSTEQYECITAVPGLVWK